MLLGKDKKFNDVALIFDLECAPQDMSNRNFSRLVSFLFTLYPISLLTFSRKHGKIEYHFELESNIFRTHVLNMANA